MPRAHIAAFLVPIVLMTSHIAQAQSPLPVKERTITISAGGTVTARPDEAAVTIGVVSSARNAKAALAANNAAMQPVIDALKGVGIDTKDLATANFNLQPTYEYTNDGKPPKLTGYQVTNAVEVRVRAIARLGDILDTVVGQGSNQISGINFIVSKAEDLKDEARKSAVANATRMAKTYAAAAGVALGEVQSISEAVEAREFGQLSASMAPKARAAGPAPIEPGEQTLEARVTMIWAIK